MTTMKLCYRYSPLAPCTCHLTTEVNYYCCWKSPNARYQDDSTGALCGCRKMLIDGQNDMLLQAMMRRMQMARETDTGFDPNVPLFTACDASGRSLGRPMTLAELRQSMAEGIRRFGLRGNVGSNATTRDKTRIGDWDPLVFAGCVERLDDPFAWTDTHWELERAEVKQRTKEWNKALEKYVNDIGLTGSERSAVVEKHTASPLAPCANLSCDKWETKVKQFRNCSRCKAVAYCSRECQSSSWMVHKKACIHK